MRQQQAAGPVFSNLRVDLSLIMRELLEGYSIWGWETTVILWASLAPLSRHQQQAPRHTFHVGLHTNPRNMGPSHLMHERQAEQVLMHLLGHAEGDVPGKLRTIAEMSHQSDCREAPGRAAVQAGGSEHMQWGGAEEYSPAAGSAEGACSAWQ